MVIDFDDSLDAHGLVQHVVGATHKTGHTLDAHGLVQHVVEA